jgi:signal-transduction protein with cAMP-binding, CBS, and nucleotidyltransferase domain
MQFSNYSYEQRIKLAQHAVFVSLEKGTRIAKRCNSAQYVYFVLTGQAIGVTPSSSGLGSPTIIYRSPGDTIGLDSVDIKTTPDCDYYNSDFMCYTNCGFLRIRRGTLALIIENFFKILSDSETDREISERREFVSKLSLFRNCEDLVFDQVCSRSSIKYFAKGQAILVIGVYLE